MSVDSYIGQYSISKDICNKLVDFFEKNVHLTRPGSTYYIEKDGVPSKIVNKDLKKSRDLSIPSTFGWYPMNLFYKELQICLDQYITEHPLLNDVERFNICEDVLIQKYKPGEGFFATHFENNGTSRSTARMLVFMTYLNDVEDGGTEFMDQGFTSEAKTGNTLIWPAYFTHPHRGVISDTQEKYIITGWYSFIDIHQKNYK